MTVYQRDFLGKELVNTNEELIFLIDYNNLVKVDVEGL